ncbi:MAG: prenyltransferase/squalene oxidase repeat-containing protein [Thermoguttaceae bacterium]|nr:prenyltransferase/squalene oxidase repeat-containing protein [Thermoguttaceae bacterium]
MKQTKEHSSTQEPAGQPPRQDSAPLPEALSLPDVLPSSDSVSTFPAIPSLDEVHVLPPIIIDPDDVPETIVEEVLITRPPGPPGTRQPRKGKRFLFFSVPPRYAHLRWYELLLMWSTSRRGLGTLISILVHLVLCIALSLLILRATNGARGEPIDVGFSSDPGDLAVEVEATGVSLDAAESIASTIQTSPDIVREQQTEIADMAREPVATTPSSAGELVSTPPPVPAATLRSPLFSTGGVTKGRTADGRKYGLPGREGDTTNKSEYTVEAGLKWLAEHQLPDGGWSFNLNITDNKGQKGTCAGQCSNTSSTSGGGTSTYRRELHPSRMAATALALLPFLGAGYTHREGIAGNVYQKTIYAGLEFLKYGTRSGEHGSDFRGGILGQGMYIQGIVTLTFCEAWEMTGDASLRDYAQEGIRFIEYAQRKDGGWRYHVPVDTDFFKDVSGDTTVTGWQMLALKSAISAKLDVRSSTVYNVGHFLDSVQGDDIGLYHYLPRKNESSVNKMHSTTAVGLLLRQYLGWKSDHPAMKKGLAHLTDWISETDKVVQALHDSRKAKKYANLFRPTSDGRGQLFMYNLYFTYYASLVLHNYGGSDWHRAFKRIRDFLIETQANQGHETGSWLFYDEYTNDGGRLLNTALSILILETPYRYLPMYK